MVYLDNNSTTRVPSKVLECMVPFFCEKYFNPTSTAGELFKTHEPIHRAKSEIAKVLNTSPEEFVLTSGATESNNWAIRAAFERWRPRGGNIVVSSIEHPSVLEAVRALALRERDIEVRYLPVTGDGIAELDIIDDLVDDRTFLFSLMLANNETGAIQPVSEAAVLIKEKAPHCLFHTDATQAIGKIPIDMNADLIGVDLLSLSGHKFHGPKGIGALFVREGLKLPPLLQGGGQQNGLRSGTENPALAAGFAEAVRLFEGDKGIRESGHRVSNLRKTFEDRLLSAIPEVWIVSSGIARLPGTSMLILPEDSDLVVSMLMQNGIFVSTGSACSKGSDVPSHVLTAMGVNYEDAQRAVRISMSSETTVEELNFCISCLVKTISE